MERKIIYISLLNNDYRLHFLNILVILDYECSTTDNNMYKSYILCQSIPFIAKKIGSPQRVRQNDLCSTFVIKINAQYLKKSHLS